ncbi:Glycogen phosphorylase 1-like [Heracleum sosnowskyi]|uniref:Glycogen phosphorylase 1-like n=1 Tax=Heracleum sosnowskyi TaxID=360622 RepID=A0AAD8MNT7_9APIA|nr:Glycogen phosphorylase 1-like [Heracleum sosnowskyi]
MKNTKWEQRLQVLTHILTHPTTTPSLHSQILISTQLPSNYNLDYYPPILSSKSTQLKWTFSLFLNKVSRFGLPQTSWRSKCPYQIPPPLILAKGVEEAKWGDEEKREYVSKRMRKRRLGNNINPLIPILVPNMLLLSLLLWNPYPDEDW